MVSYCLKLGPVYSRLAGADDLAALEKAGLDWRKVEKAGYQLRRHQAQTWLAYQSGQYDVIFDTALTGDGKSLAGQLPMLINDQNALLLYPTNELIKDQQKGLTRYLKNFDLNSSKTSDLMYGERITDLMEEQEVDFRRQMVTRLFKSNNYILSNPDLFYLMSSRNYGTASDRREYPYLIPENFHYFLFDEFHIFQPPQVISILDILNYHKVVYPQQKLKYVFLSATPTRFFKQLLQNSGFIFTEIKGEYSEKRSDLFTRDPIVHSITLNLDGLQSGGAFQWATEHLADVVKFYQENPGTKGVFIVNSVATAKLLVKFYKQELEKKYGILIGENTGLSMQETTVEVMQPDWHGLIIATSTVDVGVDFAINLLIFESQGLGTFIQRLGRLGRHMGWDSYQAFALLADWQVEKFSAHFRGRESEVISRLEFLEAVQSRDNFVTEQNPRPDLTVFQPNQEYKNYINRWARLQTVDMLVKTKQFGNFDKNNKVLTDLRVQYNRMYGGQDGSDRLRNSFGRYRGMFEDKANEEALILTELTTFRGRSPLNCGIVDDTENGYIKNYGLFFLLANTDFVPIAEDEFRQCVQRFNQRWNRHDSFEKYQSRELKLYVRLKSYRPERDSFRLTYRRSIKGKLNRISVFTNLTIKDSRVLLTHQDDRVNEQLAKLKLVALAGDGAPKDFKRLKKLNTLFPVYGCEDRDKRVFSLVFGLEAFLAHSLIPWNELNNNGDNDEPLIY